jgi:hypothetical protein
MDMTGFVLMKSAFYSHKIMLIKFAEENTTGFKDTISRQTKSRQIRLFEHFALLFIFYLVLQTFDEPHN